jgi:hypothetical protein
MKTFKEQKLKEFREKFEGRENENGLLNYLAAFLSSTIDEAEKAMVEQRVVDLGVFAGILDALVKYGRKSESNLERTRDLYTKKYEAELTKLKKGSEE